MNLTLPVIPKKNSFCKRDGWCVYVALLHNVTYGSANEYGTVCNENYSMACKKCPQVLLCSRIRYMVAPQYKVKVV